MKIVGKAFQRPCFDSRRLVPWGITQSSLPSWTISMSGKLPVISTEASRKCPLKSVQQENVQRIVNFHFLPPPQPFILKRRPAVRIQQRGNDSIRAFLRLSADEYPFELVGQFHVAASSGDGSVVILRGGDSARLRGLNLFDVVQHCGGRNGDSMSE